MRTIDDHKINPANDKLTIEVMDEPGSGGACHRYEVTGFDARSNPSQSHIDDTDRVSILFQNGPIDEAGVNGLTHEALLAIVADRLRSFQKGPYSTRYNALALTHIEEAQNWLNRRTIERMRRGVEGTHTV
jgi:hypothetical protein